MARVARPDGDVVDVAAGNGDEGLATEAQRARRRRILHAAAELASEGGFDAVQMREVAERADVALGTLYRYFPSKIHLLVSVLADQMDEMYDRLRAASAGPESPADRVFSVLQRSVRAMGRNPKLYGAVVRAMMFGDETTAAENAMVSERLDTIITRAMKYGVGEPTEDDLAVARLLGKIWLADILSWLAGRSTVEQMESDLDLAVRLLVK